VLISSYVDELAHFLDQVVCFCELGQQELVFHFQWTCKIIFSTFRDLIVGVGLVTCGKRLLVWALFSLRCYYLLRGYQSHLCCLILLLQSWVWASPRLIIIKSISISIWWFVIHLLGFANFSMLNLSCFRSFLIFPQDLVAITIWLIRGTETFAVCSFRILVSVRHFLMFLMFLICFKMFVNSKWQNY